MKRKQAGLSALLYTSALLSACFDGAQSPPARPEGPQDAPEGSMLGPVDIVYLCGNKFLVTNSTKRPAQVEYRVVGSDETGSLTLAPGPVEDPGYSETELETRARGVVELYQDGERVARRANQDVPCGAPPISASVAGVSGPEAGSWTAPFPLPIVALHVTLLPTGKVLMWGHLGTPQVWDPATGSLTAVPSPAWVFCAGHSFLPDGRLLVSGGHISADHGIPDNTIFHAGTESWSRSTPMRRGRWYPTNTTMANGDVVILAGRDESGVEVAEPEVWSSGSVRVLSSASRVLPYYPRAFLAPNGLVFYAGELQMTRYLNPTGTGSWTNVGNRHYPVRDYGSAVMYDEGKILYAGGGRTTATAEVIDLNTAAPAWQLTGSMAFPRRHLNATVLPTGEVLVTGGSSGTAFNDWNAGVHAAELWNPATGVWTTLASNTVTRTYHAASLLLPDGRILHSGSGAAAAAPNEENAELFSPPYLLKGPRPTITQAPGAVDYGSSFNVTTPEAGDIAKVSLIRLGSVTHAFDMNQRFQWLSFSRTGETLTISAPTSRNRTPPGHYMLFLLNTNGVPSVAKIVNVGSGAPPPTSSIELTVTGDNDATKHYMTLRWTGASGSMVDVYRNGALIKTTENDGRYLNSRNFQGQATYVYKLCQAGSGTCSNEATVVVGGAANSPPTTSFTSSCTGLTCSFVDGSTDSDGSVVSWGWDFGDETSSSSRNPSHTYEAAGTYTVTLTATDNGGARASTSKPVTVTASDPPAAIALSVTGRADATKHYMTLTWTGASGSMVDVYRNGARIKVTENDGRYLNTRTFQGAATYVYKLCQAGTTTCSNEATVQVGGGGAPPPIALSVTGRSDATKHYMTLTWSGASGTMVDVYRNGARIKVTENDGRYLNTRNFQGSATYVYKLCQAGSTTCSNEARITVS
jgi:PKD repeat protein